METQTARNACAVVVHIDDADGIPLDVSGSMNRFDLQNSIQIGEYQVFGGNWVKRLTCKKDARATLGIVYTEAALEAWKLLKTWWNDTADVARTVRLMTPTADIGSDDFIGEWLIESWNSPFDGTQAGPVMVTLNLVQTGGITLGTVAT